MKTTTILKLLLEDDAFLHIALHNGETCFATIPAILQAFADAQDFAETKFVSYLNSTKLINPKHKPLDEIAGLPMALIYNDGVVEIIYPIIFKLLLSQLHSLPSNQIKLESISLQKTFENTKEYSIKQFLDFARMNYTDLRILKDTPMRAEHKEMFFEQLSKFSDILVPLVETERAKEAEISPELLTNEPSEPKDVVICYKVITKEELDPSYIKLTKYANMHNRSIPTVYKWKDEGKLKSVVRVGDNYYVDPKEEPPFTTRRRPKVDSEGRARVFVSRNPSYSEVQEYIKGREIVTDAIRPFIRTAEEARYYRNNNLREIEIQGRTALVCDVFPDFYVEELHMTNRELMLKGKAPVVPPFLKKSDEPKELERYHLHHIGQRKDSPFAVLREYHHNKLMYSTFHQGAGDEESHTAEFDMERKDFWKKFIAIYDGYGSYLNIRYLNPLKESTNLKKGAKR